MRKLKQNKLRIATRNQRANEGNISSGSEFDGLVRDLSAEGNGIVQHHAGQVFFVPGVWLGEKVRVRVVGFKGRFGFAELVSVLEASPDRVTAPCPYQGFKTTQCGGCPWQFVNYSAQLQAKQRRVAAGLASFVKAPALEKVLKAILPSSKAFGFRNRTQFKTNGQQLGYLAAGSHALVDIENCLVLNEKNQQTLHDLRQKLPNAEWKPSRKRELTSLDVDDSVNVNSVSVNARLPFKQANDDQNKRMQTWLADKLAGLDKSQTVLELFAGSGNFTQIIAAAGFNSIVAVEVVDEAMAELRAKLPGVTTLACDLFSTNAAKQLAIPLSQAGVLILDPPRDGLKNDTLKSADGLFYKKSSLRDVFYISCNIATFLRDLHTFVEHGYRVVEVQPVDQFPHTPHIEILAHLQKR